MTPNLWICYDIRPFDIIPLSQNLFLKKNTKDLKVFCDSFMILSFKCNFFFLNDFISFIKRINIWNTSENLPKGNNSKLFLSFLLKKTFVIVFVSLGKTTIKDFQAPPWIYSEYRDQNLFIMDAYHFLVCFIFLKRSLLPLIFVP